jgi:branched-chain amino acid transport system substrate-binding protein
MRLSTLPFRRALLCCLCAGAAMTGLVGCGGGSDASAASGASTSAPAALRVAVAWPWAAHPELGFAKGLELAMEEIAASGGVHGRPITLVRLDDHESVDEGRIVAQRIAADTSLVAVIGHMQSHVSVPAAAIYEQGGVPMIAPVSSDPGLTNQGFTHVFRTMFTDPAVGRHMADEVLAGGARRIGIYYLRNEYGRAVANAFEERATERDAVIVARQSYDPDGVEGISAHEETFRQWKENGLDAVFLAGEVPSAGVVLRALRAAGLTQLVYGTDAMASPELMRTAGPAASGVIVATVFHADRADSSARAFVALHRAKYGAAPDVAAALGYDALHVLVAAMRRSASPTRPAITTALHDTVTHAGATGALRFTANGDVRDRAIVTLVVRDGQFVPVERVVSVAKVAEGRRAP